MKKVSFVLSSELIAVPNPQDLSGPCLESRVAMLAPSIRLFILLVRF